MWYFLVIFNTKIIKSTKIMIIYFSFLENFYCLILHGLNGVNSAELFERGTEVNQVYFNPGYAKEHRQRKMQKVHPCALCGHIFVWMLSN